MPKTTNMLVILIKSEEYNAGYVRTAHIFPSILAAQAFIKKEMECDDEELQCAKELTLSPKCDCYAFDDFIYHIYIQPIEHI